MTLFQTTWRVNKILPLTAKLIQGENRSSLANDRIIPASGGTFNKAVRVPLIYISPPHEGNETSKLA